MHILPVYELFTYLFDKQSVYVVGFGVETGECLGDVVEKNMLDQVCVCWLTLSISSKAPLVLNSEH